MNSNSHRRLTGHPQFPATHSFAQTNIQLINQLRNDFTEAEIDQVLKGYELACSMFTGSFRGCGKPFIEHAIGTASIIAALKAPIHVVTVSLAAEKGARLWRIDKS
ncbi:MAG: hypothetical protein P8Y12_07545 [Gammaproteobacteria bacterium]